MRFTGNSLSVQRSLSRRLMPLAYALALAVVLIMAMTWGVLQVQVTLAGFLNSESIWSKAQKQAVIDLDNYALNGAPADLASFRRNYGLLESDRWGRDAIASGHYRKEDLDAVFRRGNIIPAAQSGMTFMLRHFTDAPHVKASLDAWRSTDASIAELGRIADDLERSYARGAPPSGQILPVTTILPSGWRTIESAAALAVTVAAASSATKQLTAARVSTAADRVTCPHPWSLP